MGHKPAKHSNSEHIISDTRDFKIRQLRTKFEGVLPLSRALGRLQSRYRKITKILDYRLTVKAADVFPKLHVECVLVQPLIEKGRESVILFIICRIN